MPSSRISHTNKQPRVRFLQLEICRPNQRYLLKAFNFCSHLWEGCIVFPGTQRLKNMKSVLRIYTCSSETRTTILSSPLQARQLVFQPLPTSPCYVSPFKQKNYETAVVRGKAQESEVAAGEQDCNTLWVPSVENGKQKTEGKETNRDSNIEPNSSFLTTHLMFFSSISSNCSKGQNSSSTSDDLVSQ